MPVALQAQKREKFGTPVAAKLRTEGMIPAELYGRGIKNLHLSVSAKEFTKVFKEAGENTVVELSVDGEKHPVLIFDVKTDPVRGELLHTDFYKVRMDEKLRTHIPIAFVGVAPGVKEKQGILVKAMHEIEVEALPGDLPHTIKVELATLDDIGKSIHVRELPALSGVRYLAELETVVASISAQITEEEEAKLAEPTSVEDVAVETEEKKKEREAEKGEGEKKDEKAPKAEKQEEKKK